MQHATREAPVHKGRARGTSTRFSLAAVLIAGSAASIGLVGAALGADGDDTQPQVSPRAIADIAVITADGDPFPVLDNFAWRAFLALNWPSLTDPAHRGEPDLRKSLGDPGPRVWETFKARYELFQVDADGKPAPPEPWATYQARNPCGAGTDLRGKTLATFEPFMDFNQPVFLPGVEATPLVAQNRTYTRYETRINKLEYEALGLPGWSQGKNLPTPGHPARLPSGSIAVKASWRLLSATDTPAMRARYYVVKGANVVDPARTAAAGHVVCMSSDIALVGLHLVIRTAFRPQGIWASFEHVDNVPPSRQNPGQEPDARAAGFPYSFFPADAPTGAAELGRPAPFPVSVSHPPSPDPTPMQVVRRYPIHASTMATNRQYWALSGVRNTVWEHYMLVAGQWPTFTHPIHPSNEGGFFPSARRENLANTTMETFTQDAPSSCMACHHAIANAAGRDFVAMIDTFR